MKNIVMFFISVIIVLSSFINFNEKNDVCPTPATIVAESDWTTGSIYDISITNDTFVYNDAEVIVSEPLRHAIVTIINSDDTAFGDFDCEFKYIPEEGIYIANILDEFVW